MTREPWRYTLSLWLLLLLLSPSYLWARWALAGLGGLIVVSTAYNVWRAIVAARPRPPGYWGGF